MENRLEIIRFHIGRNMNKLTNDFAIVKKPSKDDFHSVLNEFVS